MVFDDGVGAIVTVVGEPVEELGISVSLEAAVGLWVVEFGASVLVDNGVGATVAVVDMDANELGAIVLLEFAAVGVLVAELGACVSLEAAVGIAVSELGAIVLFDDAVGSDGTFVSG